MANEEVCPHCRRPVGGEPQTECASQLMGATEPDLDDCTAYALRWYRSQLATRDAVIEAAKAVVEAARVARFSIATDDAIEKAAVTMDAIMSFDRALSALNQAGGGEGSK